jgi:hypothetical protein
MEPIRTVVAKAVATKTLVNQSKAPLIKEAARGSGMD